MPTTFRWMQAALGVRDVDASVSFYTNALGFALRAKQGEPTSFALLGRDEVQLSLVQAMAPAVAEFACCYLYVDDVEPIYEECSALGLEIVHPLTAHPWGNRDFVIRDPDGHRIAIGQQEAN